LEPPIPAAGKRLRWDGSGEPSYLGTSNRQPRSTPRGRFGMLSTLPMLYLLALFTGVRVPPAQSYLPPEAPGGDGACTVWAVFRAPAGALPRRDAAVVATSVRAGTPDGSVYSRLSACNR